MLFNAPHRDFLEALSNVQSWDHLIAATNVYAASLEAVDESGENVPSEVGQRLLDYLLGQFRLTGDIVVPFVCAGLIDRIGAHPRNDPTWETLIDQDERGLAEIEPKSDTWIYRLVSHVSLIALVKGVDQGLVRLIDLLSRHPVLVMDATGAFGQDLAEAGWFQFRLPKTKKHIRKWVSRQGRTNAGEIPFLNVISALGMSKAAPVEWLEFLFSLVLLPALKAAAKTNRFDHALTIERIAYINYTKRIENRDHFHKVMSRLAPAMRQVGLAARRVLPNAVYDEANAGARPVVAFYLHSTELLGHTEALLSMLRGASKKSHKAIDPVIYLKSKENPELNRRLDEYGVSHVYVADLGNGPRLLSRDWENIRADCRRRGVRAFVFVSVVTEMAYAFALGIAPVQIWWSMKYHCLALPEIDGYLALGSFQKFKEIEGRSWRICHRALENLHDPQLNAEAERIRSEIIPSGNKLILGCLGREEKLLSDDYARALAEILSQVPNAVFVWTGRSKDPRVVEMFEAAGIADRCVFVGWINTRIYAQVLDIFVDSFPFASGLTAFETMAAGCPVVAMVTSEALGTGFLNHIWPAFAGADVIEPEVHVAVRDLFTDEDGEVLLPLVEDYEAYVGIAVRLAHDVVFRRKAGDAARQFMENFMYDEVAMADTFASHIIEVIGETESRLSQ